MASSGASNEPAADPRRAGGTQGAAVKFTGIAASPGIGVGPIQLIVAEEYSVKDFAIPADGIDAEIGLYEKAVDASRRDLAQIRDGIAAELGEKEAAIYEAQMMIVDDPELRRAVHESIRRRRNAGISFRDHMAAVAARHQRAEHENLPERPPDNLQVQRHPLRHPMGESP